jgi:ribosomal protein S18 acetylase RimI-like enzyme
MVTSRRATSADAPGMARVAEEAYAPYVDRMDGRRPAPMDADYATLIATGEAWVAEVEGKVIGFLTLLDQGETMEVDAVAVLPSHQGLGVGRHLLTLAESRAKAAGHRHVTLYTNEAMVESQRLYEGNGYVETRRAREHGYDRVFYEKALGQ